MNFFIHVKTTAKDIPPSKDGEMSFCLFIELKAVRIKSAL
ncbi:hypothetical protein HMPREF9413_4551 [Paenibacillus sp. HGF7]|nr:hypothetical protein HMPREF9413_4551 [Paenibacillus sp. HGF7]